MDLFSQPADTIHRKEPAPLLHVPATIKEHYPEAWRLDELQTVVPLTKPDKFIRINGMNYRIWLFYPFHAYGSKKLIIYYKK